MNSVLSLAIGLYKAIFDAADEDNKPRWEGDMIMTPEVLDYFYNTNKSITGRSAYPVRFRWKDNKLPFYIDESFTLQQRRKIIQAVREMEEKLNNCIEFVHYKTIPKLKNYVVVQSSVAGACFSDVGKKQTSGPQTINLGGVNCLKIGTIQHEFIHALGFTHEQNRPDRDKYIRVHQRNIKSSACINFELCPFCNSYGVPYDFKSVMHYPTSGFSCNGRATISIKDNANTIVYQREGLTDLDVKKIRAYYQCVDEEAEADADEEEEEAGEEETEE